MRKILAFTTLAAPFALLACGSDVEEADTTEDVVDTEAFSAAQTADEGPIDTVTLADNDESGDYTMTGDDGSTSRLSLNSGDKSYNYTSPGGETFSGTYSYYDDYRLLIEDLEGEDWWFSYDNDSLYRLASETSLPEDRITVTAQYDRDKTPAAQVGGPEATTNNVADKRE